MTQLFCRLLASRFPHPSSPGPSEISSRRWHMCCRTLALVRTVSLRSFTGISQRFFKLTRLHQAFLLCVCVRALPYRLLASLSFDGSAQLR
ncbi:hypothetical protein NQZ68_020111 [Dissostichus eleginoides]|nr:hypothetical protein NQZ68_020111 [Dissostichus eleginoides]